MRVIHVHSDDRSVAEKLRVKVCAVLFYLNFFHKSNNVHWIEEQIHHSIWQRVDISTLGLKA